MLALLRLPVRMATEWTFLFLARLYANGALFHAPLPFGERLGEGECFNARTFSVTCTLTSPMLRMGPLPLPLHGRGRMSDVSTP
jgi:hypothetical protein